MTNETPAHLCRNCEYQLPEGARYCPNCSQKNHDGRYTFREMMAEILSTILNVDSQGLRTVRALAIPGKLTKDYFEGKHIRYYRPIKLFFYTGALLIAVLSIRVGSSVPSQFMQESYREKKELHQRHLFYVQLDSLKKSTAATLKNRSAIAALDTLLAKMDSSYISSDHDSLRFARSFKNDGSMDTIINEEGISISKNGTNDILIAVDDLENMDEDSILNKYGITKFWEKLGVKQQIKLNKKGDNFLPYVLGNTIWMMLFMMPMLALVLKLLYVRRRFFFFEHLIFSFHVHAFLFLFTAILVLSYKWLGDSFKTIAVISFFIASFYPMIAMKRFYRQGWVKTMVKYFISNFLYFFIFMIALVGLAFASFAMF